MRDTVRHISLEKGDGRIVGEKRRHRPVDLGWRMGLRIGFRANADMSLIEFGKEKMIALKGMGMNHSP